MGSLQRITDSLNVQELKEILLRCPALHQDTVLYLFDQEVDGEAFLSLTEASLALNFSNFVFGQRRAILKIIQQHTPFESTITKVRANDVERNPVIPIDEVQEIVSSNDINNMIPGVQILGVVGEDGLITFDGDIEQEISTPVISASFLNKRKDTVCTESSTKRQKSAKVKKLEENDIEPVDVESILNATKEGQGVIKFVRTHGFVDVSTQISMMKLIYNHYSSDKESPVKYYPQTSHKIGIAKGIIKTFPALADSTGCPYRSWLNIVTTKFETVQSSLPASKKKNRSKGQASSLPKKSKCKVAKATQGSWFQSDLDGDSRDTEESQVQKSLIRDLMPTKLNKPVIAAALSSTFVERRKWIKLQQPSCTDILAEYQHLASYGGEMIAEEFLRMEPLHEDLVSKFSKVAPYILKYAGVTKPTIQQQVVSKFGNGLLSALVILPKLLGVVLNKNTVSEANLIHIKAFKNVIEDIPSSALLQIAPEGTDVESYDSKECTRNADQLSPIFPFLLWTTNDYERGKIYLKIDRKVILVGCCSEDGPDTAILRALDYSVKAHYAFNLQYHPYLRSFYDYIEHLYGIKTPLNSVVKFVSAIRQLSQS